MNVFVTRMIPEKGMKLLEESGHKLTIWKEKRDLNQQELIEVCKQNDALLSASFARIDQEFLKSCSHLKVIALLSVGYDNVDVKAATLLNIPIGNTPGVLSNATADIAFLLMMAVSRNAFYLSSSIGKGKWEFYEPTANLGIELYGKTLGIFGLGKIGYEMAKRSIAGYGMKIIYHNRSPNKEAEKDLKVKLVSFEKLLQQSDVLSVHASLSPETKGLFDKRAFSKMKPTSIFINTARGAIHNEPNLTEALQNGLIWGAGLDVTNPEPMHQDNPLLHMANVAILPHIGSATIETRNAMAEMAAQNIIAGLKGERLPYLVNTEIMENAK
jgi:glyoxylate reductase